jgi:hypothetical protein
LGKELSGQTVVLAPQALADVERALQVLGNNRGTRLVLVGRRNSRLGITELLLGYLLEPVVGMMPGSLIAASFPKQPRQGTPADVQIPPQPSRVTIPMQRTPCSRRKRPAEIGGGVHRLVGAVDGYQNYWHGCHKAPP